VSTAATPPSPSGSPERDPYLVVERSDRFRHLRTRYRAFIFPMGALFMGWYLVFIYAAGWQREWMATPIAGSITIGYVFALLQFVTTFLIAFAYTRWADTKIDPEAEALKAEVERLDAERGTHPTHTSDEALLEADLSTGA
jgi:uncharacterized membrane protein (DUF485 family)